jgi:hypothetical protein
MIPIRLTIRVIALALAAVTFATEPATASGARAYEVWAVDQSSSPGKDFGGTIHIGAGREHERRHRAEFAASETIDLSAEAAALCLARTGANPVRPHMIAVNASQTHAIVSFVASGHVLFIDAETRAPVECLRTSVGSTGARQVHFAIPSPDETYVSVANQNGKLFERINTDYPGNSFVLDTSAAHRPRNLHDAERPALSERGAPTGQRADLPDHRFHQPLHVRDAARRRALRRRQQGHADADRRRVRQRDRARQRLPRGGGARQDVHLACSADLRVSRHGLRRRIHRTSRRR